MTATVLVIDDDANVRQSLATFLSDYGYQVVTAVDATDGTAILKRQLIDVAVCDLKMPTISGLQWLEQIRTDYPDLPVILVSGVSVMEDVVKALRLGAEDFLFKPILDLEVLHHSVARAVERVQLQRENESYRQSLEQSVERLEAGLDELQRDQMAGRHIQMKMLPERLEFRGLSCQHRLFTSLLLSGDFLDYFELDEHRLVFYIADVSGHGASSAFVTVLLKNLTYRLRRNFRRGSSDDLLDPARVLARINQEMMATDLDKHLTIFFGIIDVRNRSLNYSVGGHLPMPVLLTGDDAEFLPGRGMPVGLFTDAQYETQTLELPDEFRLLMFSDGILEVMPAVGLQEKERSLLALCQQTRGSFDALVSPLGLEAMDNTPDDIAMVCIGSEGFQ